MKTRTLMVLLAAVFLSGSICLAQSEAVAPLRANEFTIMEPAFTNDNCAPRIGRWGGFYPSRRDRR